MESQGHGGEITDGANNITIQNSAFSDSIWIRGVRNGNIVLDNNTHLDMSSASEGSSASIFLPYDRRRTQA